MTKQLSSHVENNGGRNTSLASFRPSLLAFWFALVLWQWTFLKNYAPIVFMSGTLGLLFVLWLVRTAPLRISKACVVFYSAYFAVALLGTLLQADPELSSRSFKYTLAFVGLCFGSVLFANIYYERLRHFLHSYGLLITVSSVAYVFLNSPKWTDPAAFFGQARLLEAGNPNGVAFTLAAGFPFLLLVRRRWLKWTLLLVGLVALYMTGSRASLLALPVGGGIVLLVQSVHSVKRTAWTLVVLCALFLLVWFNEPVRSFVLDNVLKLHDPHRGLGTGFTGRTDAWDFAIQLWKKKPFFGYGMRASGILFSSNWTWIGNLSSPHNGYLAVAVDNGIAGLLTYLLTVGWVCLKLLPSVKRHDLFSSVVLWFILWYLAATMFERFAINFGNPSSALFFFLVSYVLIRGRLPNGDAGPPERAGPPRERPAPAP